MRYCLFLFVVFAAGAQSYRSLDSENYDKVLNLLFPHPPDISRDVIFSLTVRFLPSFGNESQVTAALLDGNRALVEYAAAKNNIYYTCEEILRGGGSAQPDLLASKIAPPIHRSLSVAPQRLIAWQALDGTICEIWYKQGLSEFHWSIAQSATGPATGKWAEDLRRELGKQSQP